MDSIHEQLVTTQKTAKYKAANGATYVLGVLGVLMIGSMMIIPAVLLIAIAAGLFFLKRNLYVEYEYGFTNGEIDVDKIYEMNKRKRVLTFSVKDMELLAPADSYYVKDFANKPDKVYKFYPETNTDKVYVGMLTGGTERAQVMFVPNEELLELCYKYNPRAVKKNV